MVALSVRMLLAVVCLTLGKLCRDVKRYVMYLLCAVCNRECIEMMGATPDMLEDVKEYYKGGVSSKPPPPRDAVKKISPRDAVNKMGPAMLLVKT